MAESLNQKLKEFLKGIEGKEITLKEIRGELKIDPESPAWDGVRVLMFNLVQEKIAKPSGKKDGVYKILKQIIPVPIFSIQRERRPPFQLIFPRDFNTMMEMDFADKIVIREGDLILISGVSNLGKTALALNFCGENINNLPVLMGNEYTNPQGEPMPRFLNRLDAMDASKEGWINWVDENGNDKFTLLPVREDFAEYIVKDRINIVDWINIETGEHYMIGTILDGMKRQNGRGVTIAVIQKAEGADAGRGGQFTKDFADVELLIDKLGESETLLTIGKVKEYTKPIIGKTYGFGILQGVKIINFREVKKCPECHGSKFVKGGACSTCHTKGWVDK